MVVKSDIHSVVKVPFVRSPYNYDAAAASDETALRCEDPSRTSQSFAQESDINWIVDNFTRMDPVLAAGQPQFGDFTDLPRDYHAALNQVRNAESAFMTLPANVRSKFANDPGQLLAFLTDDRNRDEAVKLGLLKEDLSKAPAKPPTERSDAGAVGKSGKGAKAPVRASNESLGGGNEGDE